jgi:polysaccharide pyruvyl transferase CsaB
MCRVYETTSIAKGVNQIVGQIRAVLCGYYGKGNAGDEALLASLLQMLPPEVTPVVLSGDPQATRDRYGVQATNRMSAIRVWQALRRSQVFIWGGGSLIQDATSFTSPLYYAGLMGLAQQLGLTTIAWAQGIGPLERSFVRQIARHAFRGCDAVSVRDARSAQFLVDWQVPFTLAPDPVWALDSKPVEGLWDIPAPRVAVNLRSHRHLTPERLEILTQAIAQFQKATDTFILLVPFQASQDLAIAQTIHARLPEVSSIYNLDDPRQIKGLFRGVEMAIGMRFHSLIMAAAEHCRCFALSYDPKVSQLIADLNLPGWELSDLPTDPNTIAEAWIEHYANGDRLNEISIHSLVDRSLIHRQILCKGMEKLGIL